MMSDVFLNVIPNMMGNTEEGRLRHYKRQNNTTLKNLEDIYIVARDFQVLVLTSLFGSKDVVPMCLVMFT